MMRWLGRHKSTMGMCGYLNPFRGSITFPGDARVITIRIAGFGVIFEKPERASLEE